MIECDVFWHLGFTEGERGYRVICAATGGEEGNWMVQRGGEEYGYLSMADWNNVFGSYRGERGYRIISVELSGRRHFLGTEWVTDLI